MAQATVSAQVRMRAGSLWQPPPPPTAMHTRPLRSSPLAGPAFSTLPTIISESSEESHGEPRGKSLHELDHTRSQSSSSVVSQAASGSGYGTGYGSGNGSMLVEAEGSTSSVSLPTGANGPATSSQGHGNSSNSTGPARLSKSLGGKSFFGRAATSSESPGNERSISPSVAVPPRTRTISGHSRSVSLPTQYTPSPPQHSSIPQVYSQPSSRPTSPASSTTHLSIKSDHAEAQSQNAKQSPSTSRDPASNWMSSSPFGPATTPKFSRLALASPAVVMPLSAKEYRKKKAKESKGKDKELPVPPNHVTFTDTPISRHSPVQTRSISPPPKAPEVPSVSDPPPHVSPSLSGSIQHQPGHDPDPDPRSIHPPHSQPASPPVSPVIHATSLQPSKLSVQSRPSSPKRPPSRPITPPRSLLTAQPLISPKSSTNTFFSFTSSDDEASFPLKDTQVSVPVPPSSEPSSATPDINGLPPARPRPRLRRRKSFPERLSNGGLRLSLLEAVNRLSQEGSLNPLSPKNSINRLSTMSEASGNTLFYDFSDSERDERERGKEQGHIGDESAVQNPRLSVLHTQSLEDLSSTLARTGIDVVERGLEDETGLAEDGQKAGGKRNVRMVRISDIVEVSPPPAPRRRKLTKSRPAPPPAKEQKTQNHERRTSLLRWRSMGSGDGKAAVVGVVDAREKNKEEGRVPMSTSIATPSNPPPAVEDVPPRPEIRVAFDGSPARGALSGTSTPTPEEGPPSMPPRRGRRSTFQFISVPSFHIPKREKSKTEPVPVSMNSETGKKGKKKGSKGVESGFGTDSTGTSTVTQGSQSTLTPISNASAYSSAFIDLTIVTPPPRQVHRKDVPDLQTLILQEREKALGAVMPSQRRGDSTPSLITNGSTATSSSAPGSLPFVPRPSTLKESFTDTSEDDSEGISRAKIYGAHHPHQRRNQSALLTPTETSGDDEKLHQRTTPRRSSRPGTGSSTLTTATTASYASFSTVPGTTSSPSSSSSSLSPLTIEEPFPAEKPNEVVHMPAHTGMHHCEHCGHAITQAPPMHAHEPDKGIPLMFTVPLVTTPLSVVSRPNLVAANVPLSGSTATGSRLHSPSTFMIMNTAAGKGPNQTQSPVTIVSTPAAAWQQQTSTRRNDKHRSVPAPAPAPSPVPTKLNPTTPPRAVLNKSRPNNVAYPAPTTEYPPELTIAITSAVSTQAKQRRPQTAPAGTGDTALKFLEAARVKEASTFAGNGFGSQLEPVVKGTGVVKNARRESKLKSVLVGWLKRS